MSAGREGRGGRRRAARPRSTTAVRAAGALALAAGLAAAEGGPAVGERARHATEESTLEASLLQPTAQEVACRRALGRGLAWLAERQRLSRDGSIPVGDRTEHQATVAVTALGALAWMAGGNSYGFEPGGGRGPYGDAVTLAVDYLVDRCELDERSPEYGFIGRKQAATAVKMHSHGFATLALAQAYCTSPRPAQVRAMGTALEASVRLIERTQGVEGGWYYLPERQLSHEGSVTICLVQALRAARNAGFRVEPRVVARAESYVKRSQHDDGGFAYQVGDPDSKRTVALTAAGISTLYATGEYAGASIDRGLEYIARELLARESGDGSPASFPCYERLYLAQAYWQHTDLSLWKRWSAEEFQRLLATQQDDGSWRNERYGDAYATAVNCLVLAMSEELLPIFLR